MENKYELRSIDDIALRGGRIVKAVYASGEYSDGDFSTTDLPNMLIVDVESSLGDNSLIRHRIWLPDNWNGIFLAVGNGGYAGRIGVRVCLEAAEGYAMAQTDMGTSALRESTVVKAPDDMWLDYGCRSTHVMAEVAKQLIEARYGKAPKYSYFNGGSAGGIQAFVEFQKHPEDFDGIIARVPSNNGLRLITYFLWTYLVLRDNDDKLIFNSEEKARINQHVLEFFGKLGKAKDGYVTYGWDGEDTVERFIGYLAKEEPDFSEEKLSALKKLYCGPVNKKNGKRIYCGCPFGAEINNGYIDEADEFGFPWFEIFFGEGFKNSDFDFGDMFDQMEKKIGRIMSHNDPELSAFKAHGGKIICYSGGADPFGPWADAMKYYNRTTEKMGGLENTKDFFRYFLIPGRDHGDRGAGFGKVYANEEGRDLVWALRNWRERGIEPEYLYATHTEDVLDDRGEKCGERVCFSERIYPYLADKKEGVDFPPCCDDSYLD